MGEPLWLNSIVGTFFRPEGPGWGPERSTAFPGTKDLLLGAALLEISVALDDREARQQVQAAILQSVRRQLDKLLKPESSG